MIELEPPPRRIGWMIAAAAAAAVIFAFDLVTPLSYAVPMLYVFPILLTWLAPGRRITLFIAGTVLVLTWVGNLYSPRQFTSDVMANCFLATALLLVIGWLVTKQKRLLEQREADQTTVRESEMRYQRLVEAISAVTWFCPPSGLHIVPQPSWMAFTGQSAEQMLGAGWAQAVHPDDVAAATRLLLNG